MTTLEILIETLKAPLTEELKPAHLEKLRLLAREISFDRDQVLFHEGQECDDFYVILSGKVALEIMIPGGGLSVQTLNPGDELGWSSVLMRDSRYFQARCLGKVRVLAFSGSELLTECRHDPELGFAFMYRLLGVVADRLQATRVQLIDVFKPHAKAQLLGAIPR